ncbi:MAG: hypothetical protein HZA04_09165 [Nitrospinae bacterium]|nr:hypothetical protein [Nitrospinota bacterium]
MAAFILYISVALFLFALFACAGAAVAPRTVRGQPLYARIAVGFALFPVLCVVPLYAAHSFIPSFLILLILAAIGIGRVRFNLPGTPAERLFWAAMAANLLLLAYGVSAHPGLGDHDPYEHAMGASYLYETATLFAKEDVWRDFATLDPYPPGYDASSAALASLAGSVGHGLRLWGLICAAAFPVAVRFFARGMGLSERSSALAGCISVLLPPSPTHFAWTHTMGIGLALSAAGGAAMALQHRKWMLPAGLALAGLGLSATSDALYALALFAPAVWRAAGGGKLPRAALVLGIALLVSAPWIVHVGKRFAEAGPLKFTRDDTRIRGHYDVPPETPRPWYKEHRGNARPYGADEFFLPRWKNNFNIPVGLPAAAFLPALAGCLLWWRRKRVAWLGVLMAVMLVAVQGERLPAEYFPHRAWTYLAVFSAIGCAVFLRYGPSLSRMAATIAAIVAFASFGHSAAVRIRMESMQWGNEAFQNEAQRDGYYRLLSTLHGEKTWPFAGDIRFGHVSAMGGRVTFWDEKERAADLFVARGKYEEATGLLIDAGYRFFVLDSTVDLRHGAGTGEKIYRALAMRGDMRPLSVGPGFALFAVTDTR